MLCTQQSFSEELRIFITEVTVWGGITEKQADVSEHWFRVSANESRHNRQNNENLLDHI